MNREELITHMLGMLVPAIRVEEDGNDKLVSKICILSDNEVEIRDYQDNRLYNLTLNKKMLTTALYNIVSYDIDSECSNYTDCLYEEDEEAAIAFEQKDIYDPELIPGHIYHSLRFISDMLEEYEKATGDLTTI